MTMYYYKGKTVRNVRFYRIKGKGMVEFDTMDGEHKVLEGNVLSTLHPDFEEGKKRTVNIVDKEPIKEPEKVEPKEEEPVETVVDEEPVEEAPVEEIAETEVEDFDTESSTLLKITDLDGDVDEGIVDFDSKEFTDLVEKHTWDLEAIEKVLDGTQKTHKGYTFEWV